MNSQTLREARKYEEASEKMIPADHRPEFHLSVRTGWMNDPNGFSYYKGKYHMFYQYYPYDSHWNSMHWGHAVSEDLLHWEYLPAALAPDESYDRDGCFSGSAATLPDGRQLLMYTGVVQERHKNGAVVDWQNQCIAVGDGVSSETGLRTEVDRSFCFPALIVFHGNMRRCSQKTTTALDLCGNVRISSCSTAVQYCLSVRRICFLRDLSIITETGHSA